MGSLVTVGYAVGRQDGEPVGVLLGLLEGIFADIANETIIEIHPICTNRSKNMSYIRQTARLLLFHRFESISHRWDHEISLCHFPVVFTRKTTAGHTTLYL